MYDRTSKGAKTLPGKYYTADSIYHLESDRIFTNEWLYAGRVSQLPAAGSYFLHKIDNESLIILRDQQNEIRAFYNVCRHRGTQLCTEASGRFSKSIQCPYHAWTYGLNGDLIGAPNMHEVPDFSKAEYPLHPVTLSTWEGGIFINLSAQPDPFDTAFAILDGKFGKWRLEELTVAHQVIYEVGANWKLIMQNYSECYHFPNLHPVLNKLTPYRNSYNDLEEGPFFGGPMRMSIEGGSMTMSGQRCAAPLEGITGDDLNRVYYYVVFPNFLLSLHPDYVLVHRLERIAPDKTKVICEWLFHPEAIADPDFDPSGAIEFWNMTNLQDWHVCELSQQGVSSRAYVPGPYAELESMIAAFDRQYLHKIGHLPDVSNTGQ